MADLFSVLSFRCGISAPNRVALAPLTNTQSHDDGTLGDDELRWLVRRARGGWGLISTCAAHVSAEGKGFVGQLGLFSDAHEPGLRTLASALVAEKTVPIVQLYHGGARSPFALTGKRPVSAVAGEGEGDDVARAMTEDEILACVEDFASAAARAQRAGFVGAEVHGAHGYLLCQFLSRNNTRADRWGGALEGRARIVREVIRAVRSRCGPGFLLGVRLSPEDIGFAAGMDLDESVALARWFAEDGADFVHLSLWDYNKPSIKRPGEDVIALFRQALDPAVRLLVAGRIGTVADADAVLSRGADMVSIGRAAILEPDWPTRARDANWSPEGGPLSRDELIERAVSARFVEYLRRFKTIVRAE